MKDQRERLEKQLDSAKQEAQGYRDKGDEATAKIKTANSNVSAKRAAGKIMAEFVLSRQPYSANKSPLIAHEVAAVILGELEQG